MMSFARHNPIDLYNCRFNEPFYDAKRVWPRPRNSSTFAYDDEITDSKGLFLDSHGGLCPVDKKIWRE